MTEQKFNKIVLGVALSGIGAVFIVLLCYLLL